MQVHDHQNIQNMIAKLKYKAKDDPSTGKLYFKISDVAANTFFGKEFHKV